MPTETWSTNTTLESMASWLRTRRRIIVLTHVKPDGDAMGSTLAIARTLNLLRPSPPGEQPSAEIWYFGPMPTFADAIVGDSPIQYFQGRSHPAGEPDAIVIADTGSWNQLEQVKEWLAPRADRAVLLDHHRHGDAETASRRFIDMNAAAACQIAAEFCRILLNLPSVSKLPPAVAQMCYLGMATDTGWFRHSNTTPAVFRTAADLLDAGVNAAELYRVVEQTNREARVRLLGRALAGMELHDHGRYAFLAVTRADFADTHAEQGDAGGFADYAQTIESVRVVAMFTESDPDENGKAITKVSFRSKETPDGVDVNQLARRFDGGGHIRAAGARIPLPLAEAKRKVLEALRSA
jgi:phosphoesterase RecJ-like protein